MRPRPSGEVLTGPAASWEGRNVTVAEVTRRLAELRCRVCGATPHGRATLLNLVVWAPSDADAEEAFALARGLVGPSRVVVVSPGGAGEGIRARAVVHAAPSAIAGVTVCEELVRIDLGGTVAAHAASVVLPLTRGDLPTFLWWPCAPRPDLACYRDLVGLVDRLVLESARTAAGPEAVRLLAAEIGERAAAVTDLAWAAVTPWRQLIAQMLTPPRVAALRTGPSRATVRHPAGPPPLETLLLGGWLLDAIGGKLTVVPTQAGHGVPPVAGIELTGPEGRTLRADRVEGSASCTVRVVDEPGAAPRRRTLPLRLLDRAGLIAGELELQGHDASFERAVRAARALAG